MPSIAIPARAHGLLVDFVLLSHTACLKSLSFSAKINRVCLGPWMKLVDVFWHSHVKQMLQDMKEQGEKAQQEQLDELRMQARTAREDAKKLKVLKKAMFGEYISNVPVFKCGRYKNGERATSDVNRIITVDVILFVHCLSYPSLPYAISIHFSPPPSPVPLLASEAHPVPASKLKKEKATWNVTRVYGQHLEGVMIPTIEDTIHLEEEEEDDDDDDEEDDTEDSETKPLVNGKKKPFYSLA